MLVREDGNVERDLERAVFLGVLQRARENGAWGVDEELVDLKFD